VPLKRFDPRTFFSTVGATGHFQERSKPHPLQVEVEERGTLSSNEV